MSRNFNYSNYENKYIFNYSQYKNNLNTKNNFSFLLSFFLIILLAGLCVFLAPQPKTYSKFYYVEIENFQTYTEAINLSNQIKENGGAGYIYFDTSYHVLASFYSSKKDAKTVKENLIENYPSSEIFELECKNFNNIKTLSNSQNLSIKNLIETTKKTIFHLEDLAIKLDKNETTYKEISILLKKHQKDFISRQDEFLSQFKTNSKFNTAKGHILTITTSLSNISNANETNFSSVLRYEIINLSIQLYNFSNCF